MAPFFPRAGAGDLEAEGAAAGYPAGPGDPALASFILGMPKAELHVHVEGMVDPTLAFELAERNKLQLPFASPEQFERSLHFTSLESFLAGFDQMLRVLVTAEDFRDTALHYFEKAAAQNIVYAELHFETQPHLARGLALESVLEGIVDAQQEALARFGIRSRLIMALQREATLEQAGAACAFALQHRDAITGIGLDSFEVPGFPAKFAELYARAADAGFRLTSHCDLEVEESLVHVRDCIEDLGVERIDHGYSVLEDDTLSALCRERGIGFTACPTTDWTLPDTREDFYAAAVTAAIGAMLDAGLQVSVNSDDPGLMGGRYVGDLLIDVQRDLDLSPEQVATLAGNAFRSSWGTAEEKRGYLGQLGDYIATHGAGVAQA
ncbi:adenosine deaminase [Pseudohaliea sp.]|uniref:adenosine deaminase n=1 Tax=Pseudohaliea sp. TaxID=2740289 RepID=UPI0032F02A0F